MRAVLMRSFGSPDVLHVEQVPTPSPAPGEALVRVAAVEVARTRDVATRSGAHPFSQQVTLPHVLGGDFAGVVASVGERADPGLVGQRVAVMNTHTCGHCAACRAGREYECTELRMIGIHRWGSYAEYATVPVDGLHPLPDSIEMAEAAALAASGPIALTQLRTVGVEPGGNIFLPGATGALATVVVALAGRLGIRVVGSSRRPSLVAAALGVPILDANAPGFAEDLAAASGGGPDGVIDNIGTPAVFDRYLPTLRNGARIVVSGAIATADGPPSVSIPLGSFYVRSLALIGVRTTTRSAIQEFWELVRAGFRLPPGLIRTFPLADAAAVHAEIDAGDAFAHNVLVVDRSVQ